MCGLPGDEAEKRADPGGQIAGRRDFPGLPGEGTGPRRLSEPGQRLPQAGHQVQGPGAGAGDGDPPGD